MKKQGTSEAGAEMLAAAEEHVQAEALATGDWVIAGMLRRGRSAWRRTQTGR